MSKEERVWFESELLKKLKGLKCSELTLSASKNMIKFRLERKVIAELSLQYIVRSNQYILNGRVFGGPIFECSSKITPPYKSNIFADFCLAFTTSGRSDKKFSNNIYGSIDAPRPEDVDAVSEDIIKSLENYYIPMILGCIFPTSRTIDDVISSPLDYAYPAVFIHCAILCNPGIVTEGIMDKVRSNKKIIKNKKFDLALLEQF